MIYSECGRPWPCKCKHEQFDSETYRRTHIKVAKKKKGGYSEFRERTGEFQPGCDKEDFK